MIIDPQKPVFPHSAANTRTTFRDIVALRAPSGKWLRNLTGEDANRLLIAREVSIHKTRPCGRVSEVRVAERS